MESNLTERLERVGNILGQHGAEMIQALLILVIGLIALHWLMKRLKILFDKTFSNRAKAATILSSLYVFLLTVVLAIVLVQIGMDGQKLMRLIVIISLVAIAAIILLRPYIPTLPFKVGNTVKVGDLLGKIEATTLVHTRMRTFDGKTVFIPNEKMLRDFVINYHATPTRRIKINIPIRHIKDIVRTKQLLEKIMIEDPRVLLKPARPVVYTLNLVDGCVEMGARCWVDNAKFWVAQCDLLEKMLLKIEQQGITLAFRQKVVQLVHDNPIPNDELVAGRPMHENQSGNSPSGSPAMSAISNDNIEA